MDPNNPTPAPQEQQNGNQDYSYNDLKDQSIREIAEGQEVPKPAEAAAEAPEEPEVPLEDIAKKAGEEGARAVIEEQEAARKAEEEKRKAEEVKLTPEEEQYEKWKQDFEKNNKRPPTFMEAMKFVKDEAVRDIREQEEQERKAQEEQQEKARKEQEETDKKLNSIVDDELNDLYNSGKLTRIKDPNNPSDQGVVERRALFQAWQEVNTQRRAEGKPEIVSATRIYEFHYKRPNAQPAGANAPVAGNRGTTTPPSEEQEYSYQDLKRPWSFFRRGQ